MASIMEVVLIVASVTAEVAVVTSFPHACDSAHQFPRCWPGLYCKCCSTCSAPFVPLDTQGLSHQGLLWGQGPCTAAGCSQLENPAGQLKLPKH